MGDMIKMVVVLMVLSSLSGGLLAAVRDKTLIPIENQQLKFDKAPAILAIFEGASNDPVADRFKLKDGDTERSFFVAKMEGKALVAFETAGKGYGGNLGVMIGVDPATDEIVGVGVTTHSETPGLGSRAKTEPSFAKQFKGMALKDTFKVKDDDGQVDALSGATLTSRGVAMALTDAADVYTRLKPQLSEKLKAFSK
jgi:Na+-translocating ferredoxin:NAD+ oxidoreductase subunit G